MSESRFRITLDGLQVITMYAQLGQAAMEFAAKATEAAKALLGVAKEGAKIEQLRAAYTKLGGTQKDILALRDATANLVPDSALIRMRNVATLSGLSSAAISKLGKVATGAATGMGRDFTESFERIILGTSKLEREFFDELGIKLRSMTIVYGEFAKKAGISVKELTEAQKQQAFVQEVLRNSTKQLALQEQAKQDTFGASAAQFENMKDAMTVAFAGMVQGSGVLDMLGGAMEQLQTAFQGNAGAIQQLVQIGFRELMAFLPPTLAVFEALLPLLPLVTSSLGQTRGIMHLVAVAGKVVAGVLGVMLGTSISILTGALGLMLVAMAKAADFLGVPFPEGARAAGDELLETTKTTMTMVGGLLSMDEAVEGSTLALGGLVDEAQKAREALIGLGAVIKKDMPDGFKSLSNLINVATVGFVDMGDMGSKAAVDVTEDWKNVNGMVQLTWDKLNFGVNATSETIIATSKTQGKALQKLALEFETVHASLERLKTTGAMGETQFDILLAELHKYTDEVEADIFKAEKFADKSRSRSSGKAKRAAEEQARLAEQARFMTLSELEQQIATSDKRYDDILSNLQGHEELKTQLINQRALDRRELIREHNNALAAAENSALEGTLTARALAMKHERDAVAAHFIAMRALVGGLDVSGSLAGEEAAQLKLLDTEQAAADFEQLKVMAIGFADFVAPAFDGVEAKVNKVSDIMTKRAARDMQIWAGAIQTMGTTFGTTMVQMASSGEDMREQTAQMMGQLFGQLSTAFLAWAVAEGNLLSGNPFAAAAAAIALGTVAAAISSFGNRGSKSGGGGGGGGGASSTAARLASREAGANRREDQAAGVVVYNYGFEQPDDVAQRVGQGERRARSLRGSGSRRGRNAA